MLSRQQLQAASDFLWRLWNEGRRADELPSELRPTTRAEGYAVQALIESRSRQPLFGWKIAATSRAGQAHINVDGPLAGRLLAEKAFSSGAALPFGANHMRVAEAEFAFRMARDLPPRSAPYRVEEVTAAIGALHPAIEIPDSRYDDFTKVGAAQLIADNGCAHLFVLGDAADESWRAIDLVAHRVRATNGAVTHDGNGGRVLGDPLVALTWLVNELSGLGITLQSGEVVTTGTCITPLPIAAGDEVKADFGELGLVSVRLV
jgi:2-keto-4-pentenoate hydratase